METSKHSGYADYQWVIMLNRICLSFFGVWPETGKTVHRKRKLMMNIRVITILTLITCVCIIPSLHSLIRIWGNITSVTDNLQYNVPICISMIKLIVIWHKQEELAELLNMIKEDWMRLKTEEERAVMIKRAQTARMIIISACIMFLCSSIGFVIFPSLGISLRYVTNMTDPGKLMPLQTYYLYNVSKSPFYEATYILQSFSIMAVAAIFTNTDTFLGLVIFHICGQLENLKERIFHLNKFNNFEYALSCSVKEHIRLIRSVKIIDNTFTLMLLALLVYFGVLFALYGFLFVSIITQGNLSIPRLSIILVAFISTFTHMCLYCCLGEFLVTQCDGIYNATCQYKWYKLEPRRARILLILMLQTKKPLYLTAGKHFPMTMATFCNLLKTSAGYISVLLAHRE